jgi:hypothetical protein
MADATANFREFYERFKAIFRRQDYSKSRQKT